VSGTTTADGNTVLLLGWAFQLSDEGSDPKAQLSTLRSDNLVKAYHTWTGRWILILGGRIHGDATCSIPIFFGNGVVSSSLSIIRGLTGAKWNWNRDHEIRYGLGPDWYPGPLSPLDGVARLLPSQTLLLATFKVEHRPILDRFTDPEPLVCFREALLNGMGQLSAWPGPVYLALTGGIDSRTVLASAFAAGMRPMLYTQEYPGLSPGDRELPPLLAAELGLSHKFIPRQKNDPDKESRFDEHTMGQGVDADRSFYSHGQWDDFQAGSLILRGSCFEIGRAYYHRKIPEGFDPGMPKAAERLHSIHFHPLNHISGLLVETARRRQSFVTDSLRAYLSWANNNSEPSLDFRDRYYLEQRHGCWLGTAEQGIDVTGMARVSIANSHYVLSRMNQASVGERRTGAYQRATIATLAPALASFPINPAPAWVKLRNNKYARAARQAVRCIRFVAGLPTKKFSLS